MEWKYTLQACDLVVEIGTDRLIIKLLSLVKIFENRKNEYYRVMLIMKYLFAYQNAVLCL